MKKNNPDYPFSPLKTYRLLIDALWKQRLKVLSQTVLSILVVLSEGLGIGVVLLVLGSSQNMADNLNKLPLLHKLLSFTAALSTTTRIQLAVLVLLLVIVGRSGLQYVQNLVGLDLKRIVERDLSQSLLHSLYQFPIAYLQKKHSGNLLALFTQHSRRVGQIVQTINQVIANLVVLFFYSLAAFWISWPLTLLAIALLAPIALLLRPLLGKRQRLKARATRDMAKGLLALLHENLAAMKIIHLFNRQNWSINRTQAAMDNMYQAEFQSDKLASQNKPIFTTLMTGAISIMLLIGSILPIRSPELILPQLTLFLLIAFRMMSPVSILTTFQAQLTQIRPLLDEMTNFISTGTRLFLADGTIPCKALEHGITLKNVSFRYDQHTPIILHQLNLTIQAGKTTALVGPSGSGKSSLINLIVRLYDPSQGQLFIDGIDLRQLKIGSWRERVAVVNQEQFLFHATIWDNLRFAKPSASDEDIVSACKLAHAHEFILSMPLGYDTLLEERGMRLSGGQRQRIAMARAFLIDADLLILDEATSELDSQTEQTIHHNLKVHRQGRGLLIISHRLSTIQTCDHIILLENGRVQEEGVHHQLMAGASSYSEFFLSQNKEKEIGS